MPNRRRGRDAQDNRIRDALILMAVEQLTAGGCSLRKAFEGIARTVPEVMLTAEGIAKAYYRARRNHPI